MPARCLTATIDVQFAIFISMPDAISPLLFHGAIFAACPPHIAAAAFPDLPAYFRRYFRLFADAELR